MRILPLPFLSLICSLSIWLTSTVCVTAANYPGATCARGRCESPLCQKCATKKLASQKHFCDAVEFEKCACEKCVTNLATVSCGGVAATDACSVATKQFTVVLTCPSDARVTIGGQLTYATGSTRQYQLKYDDKRRTYRLEMKVRINEEHATFLFDHDIHCDDGKILALAVTREQMTKVSDTHWSAEIAKHLQTNTVLRVTDDQKLELLSFGDRECRFDQQANVLKQPLFVDSAISLAASNGSKEGTGSWMGQQSKEIEDGDSHEDGAPRRRRSDLSAD